MDFTNSNQQGPRRVLPISTAHPKRKAENHRLVGFDLISKFSNLIVAYTLFFGAFHAYKCMLKRMNYAEILSAPYQSKQHETEAFLKTFIIAILIL